MSLQLLPLGTCLLRWHQQVDALWHHTPSTTFQRTITRGVRAGVEETVCRRGKRQVVDGAKYTGEILLKQYRKRVEGVLNSSLLFSTLVTDTGIVMPSILVDGRLLMQQRSLTERTMRNHIRQLLSMGFIARKKWHGRKRQYELWINPEFILKPAENAVENAPQADSEIPTIDPVYSTNGNKFPPIELPELPEAQISDIGQCGEIPRERFSERPLPEAEGRNQGGEDRPVGIQGTGGRGAAKTRVNPAVDKGPAEAAKQAQNEAYVVSAWLLAKALLYPEHRFSEHQERLAKRAIWQGVYAGFQDESFDFATYHQGVLRRIELVEKYLQRNAGRENAPYLALPWAEVIRGKGYFDWENEKGFRGTMAWLLADQLAEHLARVNRAVKRALGELKLRRQLDRGGKTTRRPAAHILATSFAGLYHHHLAALGQLGGRRATDKFNTLVLNLR